MAKCLSCSFSITTWVCFMKHHSDLFYEIDLQHLVSSASWEP